jgi:superfamily II DNA or RNA helicase/uncharacterized membrane protein YgcG
MDIPLIDFPVPDADILAFLLENVALPQEGEVVQDLRIKKLLITHLDCLTKPTEAKQRQRTTAIRAKATSSAQDDALFGALAKQAWDFDGTVLPRSLASGTDASATPGISVPIGSQTSSSTQTPAMTSYGASTLSAKQAVNFSMVFDKKTNVDEWELVRKAVYVIGRWFGDDLALVCLGSFLEMRERKEMDLLKLLGFLPTTTAQDKELFASLGFPDIPDATAKKEKREIKARLSQMHHRSLLRSRHMPDRENVIIWMIDLLNIINSAIYRMDKLKTKILENISALKTDLMYCPQCNAKYGAQQIQQLQRRGNHYLCNTPCSTILQMIDTQDLIQKYTAFQKKIPQFSTLVELLSNFRNRDQPKGGSGGGGGGGRKTGASGGGNAAGGAGRPKGTGAKATGGHRGGGALAASNGAQMTMFAKHEPPAFMAAMVTSQSSEHYRIQESEPPPFDIHPISFGDPMMEDYRIFIPVIDTVAKSDLELGFNCAKLLLDNIADFLHMIKLNENSKGYHYCYNLSLRSLFIAHKRGFRPTEILRYLRIMSSGVPPCIVDRVMASSKYVNYYPASMVLVNCRYFVRSKSVDTLKAIQNLPGLSHCFAPPNQILKTENVQLDETYYWLEVHRPTRSLVKEKAYENGMPIIDEYSFVLDTSTLEDEIEAPPDVIRMKKVPVVLTPNTRVRDYQSMSCSKLYWDSFRCHSGILILPCGAGKTLIGITAFATLQYPTIIFCQSTLAATQWTEQIKNWTNLSQTAVSALTSMHKDRNPDAEVVVTTYAMFAGDDTKRNSDSKRLIDRIRKREWGLMILDEVHQAPADTFRLVTANLICHLKLGLTATLVREDAKVAMLPSLVGPTLFELDVSTLRKRDHIAPIECHEIRLPFTPYWKDHYTHPTEPFWSSTGSKSAVVKELLFTTNPNKMLACMTLIKKHLQLKHKIVIFCDDLIGLDCYSRILGSIDQSRPCPVIQGSTPEVEKERIVKEFRDAQHGDWLLFSKVGDMSIDLPEARVLIQIAAAQGSRMQEGQRVGRIQRRYPGKEMAYAYSLVSGESQAELGFALRRRHYLEEHGYAVTMHEMEESKDFVKSTLDPSIEQELANRIREMLILRTSGHLGRGKGKANKDENGLPERGRPGFKRQHKDLPAEPANAFSAPKDLSLMKHLKKKFKR